MIEWKKVKDWPYEVSNDGQVRREGNLTAMKQSLAGAGYPKVKLQDAPRKLDKYIHRMVAEAFLPNPENKPQVNHKDEVKTNNHFDNLEWCTVSYNNVYGARAKKIGLQKHVIVEECDMNWNPIRVHESMHLAAESAGVTVQAISYACRSTNYSIRGRRWRKVAK